MYKKYNIICGHCGTGKTNFAINAAMDLKKRGKDVTLVDLDIVNPYFRSSDYIKTLNDAGIRVIAPGSSGTTLEAPYLSAEINSVFAKKSGAAVFDVGGDDAGAYALGRYSGKILGTGDYSSLFIINKYRNLISAPFEAVALMKEVESAAKIKITGIINNSHLSYLTKPADIINSFEYANEVSVLSGLPLLATAADVSIIGDIKGAENLYPVEIYVKTPW